MTIIWTRSRLVVRELMEKLAHVRTIEKTTPFDINYHFGNLEDAKFDRPPRIIWINEGGVALQMVPAPPIEQKAADGTTVLVKVPAVGYRRSNYLARLWMPHPDEAEVLLDQLITASRLIARVDSIVFQDAPWKFLTEVEGRWLENGFALIDAHVGIRTSVPAEPIGEFVDVVVSGAEFRAGIANPAGEPLDESEYDVDRITTEPDWDG